MEDKNYEILHRKAQKVQFWKAKIPSLREKCSGLNCNGTLKYVLGCYTFGHVTSITTMEQTLFEKFMPVYGRVSESWSGII